MNIDILIYSGTSLTRTPRDPRDLYSLSGVRIIRSIVKFTSVCSLSENIRIL